MAGERSNTLRSQPPSLPVRRTNTVHPIDEVTLNFHTKQMWRIQCALVPPERKPLRVDLMLKSLFLPTGYPASVRQDYIHFQKWEVAKGIVSSAGFVYDDHTAHHRPSAWRL